ncbi:MAG: hypothetical protein LBV07_00995, partial [Syntrophobacterales bacterium]|nr:hypothetical protein [Syntrophobacterales bacterium]
RHNIPPHKIFRKIRQQVFTAKLSCFTRKTSRFILMKDEADKIGNRREIGCQTSSAGKRILAASRS